MSPSSSARGGTRPGAGRKSIFGTSKAVEKPFSMDLTPSGRRALDALAKRTRLSRNAIIAVLALQHADTLTFDAATPGVVFPDKLGRDGSALSIRVPDEAARKLHAVRARTGKSYSDIGEALVRWHGPATTFPKRPRRPKR